MSSEEKSVAIEVRDVFKHFEAVAALRRTLKRQPKKALPHFPQCSISGVAWPRARGGIRPKVVCQPIVNELRTFAHQPFLDLDAGTTKKGHSRRRRNRVRSNQASGFRICICGKARPPYEVSIVVARCKLVDW